MCRRKPLLCDATAMIYSQKERFLVCGTKSRALSWCFFSIFLRFKIMPPHHTHLFEDDYSFFLLSWKIVQKKDASRTNTGNRTKIQRERCWNLQEWVWWKLLIIRFEWNLMHRINVLMRLFLLCSLIEWNQKCYIPIKKIYDEYVVFCSAFFAFIWKPLFIRVTRDRW